MNTFSIVFSFFIHFVMCRDFYMGMFKRDDFLVAQDVVYKEASPFGYTTASYGRLFKCPITFFRVVDRLGLGRGPYTSIVRGGLGKKYINVRMKSTYKLPISVNIYVGCENKMPRAIIFHKPKTEGPNNQDAPGSTPEPSATNVTSSSEANSTTSADSKSDEPKGEEPKTEEPAAGEPTTEEPAAGEPTAEEPTTEEPEG